MNICDSKPRVLCWEVRGKMIDVNYFYKSYTCPRIDSSRCLRSTPLSRKIDDACECRGIEWKGSSGHHSDGRCMDDWPQVTWQGDFSINMEEIRDLAMQPQ